MERKLGSTVINCMRFPFTNKHGLISNLIPNEHCWPKYQSKRHFDCDRCCDEEIGENILSRCRSKLLILKCVEQWPNN